MSQKYISTADRGPGREKNDGVGVGRYSEFELTYPEGSIGTGIRVAETVLVFPLDMDTMVKYVLYPGMVRAIL